MDINHLRYLVDVAQTKSITLSAKRLFISQQGLSQIMLRLENDLKVPLLIRHRQGVTLTEAGEVVVAKAQEVIEKYGELLQCTKELSTAPPQDLPGKLSIGSVPFINSNLLPEILDFYHRQFPAVEVHLEEMPPTQIIGDINSCNIDIGLLILPEYEFNDSILACRGTYEKILENEFHAVVASNSPLAKKKTFTLSDLYRQPIAIYNFEAYLKIINHMFKDINRLNILVKTNSVELYKNALLQRQAVGITSSTDTRLLSDESLVAIPIKEGVKAYYGYFIPSSCSITPAAEAFIALLKSYIANMLNRKK